MGPLADPDLRLRHWASGDRSNASRSRIRNRGGGGFL